MSEDIEELVNSGRLKEVLQPEDRVRASGRNQEPELPPAISISPLTPITARAGTPLIGIPTSEPEAAPTPQTALAPIAHRPILPWKSEAFDIKDPVELLFLLDEQVRSGEVKLHKWQVQFMMDFAAQDYSDKYSFQALVRACNGSGKDKYVIAPCVVWLCMAYMKARGVVTSSSGKQLDSQTCTYIDMLCNAANRIIAPGIWKLNYRYYECLATGSPIECFATDEAGKAEGFHPLEYGRKMGLFMSEAKTVPDEVNTAFNKCTGYTHRAHVSTPGLPLGHFYEYCCRSPMRNQYPLISNFSPIEYIQYHITAYECSHLTETNYIEQMKRDLIGGETGAAFKSQVLAEFCTTDEMTVIPYHYIWQCVNQSKVPWMKEKYNTGGLDLALGGDETCLVVRNGNKVLAVIPFRFDNSPATKTFLRAKLHIWQLDKPEALVFADAGNMGKPMIDDLKEEGWSNLRYVVNQGEPSDKRVYKNKGAEMWFNTGELIKGGEIILPREERLIQQLGSRYYKIVDSGKHQLESKIQARAKGHPSPDRGDAFVLCFSNYRTKLADVEVKAPYVTEKPKAPVPVFTLREWAGESDNKRPVPSSGWKQDFLRDELKEFNRDRKQLKQGDLV